MRTLLVGQAPGPNTDWRRPLSGRCGARLAELCGLDLEAFLHRFDRVNLLDRFPGKIGNGDAFPMAEAREAADNIRQFMFFSRESVVFLGRNVAAAFMGEQLAAHLVPLAWVGIPAVHGFRYSMCPHPSGVCRWWNEPANLEAASAFWRALAAP